MAAKSNYSGKGRITCLPALKDTRTGIFRKKKDLLMMDLDPSHLPNIDLTKTDIREISTLVTNRQLRKQINEWFRSWRPWQKRILLCNMTEICSKEQLRALVTILEPVFHRDFTARLRGMYPFSKSRIVHRNPLMSELQKTQPNQLEEIFRSSRDWDIKEESSPRTVEICKGENEKVELQEKQVESSFRNQLLLPPSVSSEPESKSQQLLFSGGKGNKILSPPRHEHAPQFSKTVSVSNFFDPNGAELGRLGGMRTKYREGDISKLYGYAPVTFKHAKWWECHLERKLVKPRRSKLSKYFKSQLNQIEKWLNGWQSFERVEALSDVVKCCDPDALDFLSHCLIQRLKDQTDLNCVPDRILVKVLKLLDVRSLCRSSQVCHRWRYLVNSSDLWKDKIDRIGSEEGVNYLTRKIERLGKNQMVDWKLAYKEVHRIYKEHQKVKLEHQGKEEQTSKSVKVPAKLKYSKDYTNFPKGYTESELSNARMPSGVVEIALGTSLEDLGLAHSPNTTDQRENRKDFELREWDNNELTGGNLKMLNKSLKALTQGGRARDDDEEALEEEIATDIRPTMIQASNLLLEDKTSKKFRYITFAVQDVKALKKVRRLQGHMDAVLCLQFDKRRIISGSADRTIRVWDVRTGRSVHKIRGHKGGVRCLQYNDELILTGSWDMTIAVWHIVKFKRLRVLYGHTGCVSCLAFDESYLVSGSHDCTIRVWSMSTWECLNVIEAHEGAVTCLEFKGSLAVTGSADRTLKLWDISTGECLKVFEGHEDVVQTFKVIGSLIISGAADGTVMFWELETCFCEAAIQAHEGPVYWLDAIDEHFFTAGGDNLIKEWDIGTCTCLRTLQGHKGPVTCLQVESHRIVSCSFDGALRIWDLVPDTITSDISHSKVCMADNTVEVMMVNQQQENDT